MISSAILFLLYAFAYALSSPLRLLPTASLPADAVNAISTVGGYLASINFIVPVTTILSVLSAVLVIEGFIFAYKTFMWILKRLPTQS